MLITVAKFTTVELHVSDHAKCQDWVTLQEVGHLREVRPCIGCVNF